MEDKDSDDEQYDFTTSEVVVDESMTFKDVYGEYYEVVIADYYKQNGHLWVKTRFADEMEYMGDVDKKDHTRVVDKYPSAIQAWPVLILTAETKFLDFQAQSQKLENLYDMIVEDDKFKNSLTHADGDCNMKGTNFLQMLKNDVLEDQAQLGSMMDIEVSLLYRAVFGVYQSRVVAYLWSHNWLKDNVAKWSYSRAITELKTFARLLWDCESAVRNYYAAALTYESKFKICDTDYAKDDFRKVWSVLIAMYDNNPTEFRRRLTEHINHHRENRGDVPYLKVPFDEFEKMDVTDMTRSITTTLVTEADTVHNHPSSFQDTDFKTSEETPLEDPKVSAQEPRLVSSGHGRRSVYAVASRDSHGDGGPNVVPTSSGHGGSVYQPNIPAKRKSTEMEPNDEDEK